MNNTSVQDKLASSLDRRDEAPNVELAKAVAGTKNTSAVKELVDLLAGKKKDLQADSIKVLYEIGAIDPALIAPYAQTFIGLLTHPNNRLQWGAMTALSSIVGEVPDAIHAALGTIVAAADAGSVITKDHCVNILVALGSMERYAADAFALLNERLLRAPVNQLPAYAEKTLPLVNDENRPTFLQTLTLRLPDVETESKRKRLEKVIRKCN
ncbi:MAG: hypothetical protein EOO16_21365 [Chitinophagaceae bacterium]|nr:MAG: hypothetical protein EOO16_21365 [Chitinophagaceae bacterium]